MTAGARTFEEIAAELGIGERTARRDFDAALAKLRAGFEETEHAHALVVRAIVVLVLGERNETIPSVKILRRFSPNVGEGVGHASHVGIPSAGFLSPVHTGVRRRAGLPRRFTRSKP